MNTAPYLAPVQREMLRVEDLIRAQADSHHSGLKSALELLLSAGGKRIRPTITLLVGRMLGAPLERLITLAAAIELLHTATLVHDDLIDESNIRRGNPTLNASWTPASTVLAGDFLFACAAKLAADTENIPVMKLFSKTLITIVGGEITQLFSEHCQISHQDYHQRIYAKTASLFETSAWAAALISPVDLDMQERMRRFGYEMGMAFQIVDDILDFTGKPAEMGKPVGSDLRNGIVTLPAIYYAELQSKDHDVALMLEGRCPQDTRQLDRLIAAICSSPAIPKSRHDAAGFIDRALESLNYLPPSAERQALEQVAGYILDRLS